MTNKADRNRTPEAWRKLLDQRNDDLVVATQRHQANYNSWTSEVRAHQKTKEHTFELEDQLAKAGERADQNAAEGLKWEGMAGGFKEALSLFLEAAK